MKQENKILDVIKSDLSFKIKGLENGLNKEGIDN